MNGVSKLRYYGILTDDYCKNIYKLISTRRWCDECRDDRQKYLPLDKGKGEDGDSYLGIMIPGFSSPSVIPLHLMIVADSIGGGRLGDFRADYIIPLEESVSHLGHYYLDEEISTFHQYQMRLLLNWLESEKFNWIFTDLVKCYVNFKQAEGRANMKLAIKHCRKYLDNQIEKFKPMMILVLGNRVAEEYFGIDKSQLKNLKEGQTLERNFGYHHVKLLHSVFPSQNTADLWVRDFDRKENDGWFDIKTKIKQLRCSG
jgi:hypothetical protein